MVLSITACPSVLFSAFWICASVATSLTEICEAKLSICSYCQTFKSRMELFMPNAHIKSAVQPSTPTTAIRERTLLRAMSRRFHCALKFSFFQSAVFSRKPCLTFFGALGRSVLAGVSFSTLRQASHVTRVQSATVAAAIR